MHIGFTGTRIGMRDPQRATLDRYLAALAPDAFHHGDCIGADDQAHGLARARLIPVIVHPPRDPKARAWVTDYALIHPELPYQQRNLAIVAAADLLIATPKELEEVFAGGTWQTVRMARRQGVPVLVIWPTGEALAQGGPDPVRPGPAPLRA